MVLGISVLERDGPSTAGARAAESSSRKLTLTLRAEANRYGDSPAYGFDLSEGDAPEPAGAVSVPGPTIVLRRGQPVEITVVNRLTEGTAIHWHGMELESYYDGVHGWSGVGARLAPLIEPGGSFAVRFTPPRTGTFIYHTHLHDNRQLASGLYGALVVVEPGETFDPAIDHPGHRARWSPRRALVSPAPFPPVGAAAPSRPADQHHAGRCVRRWAGSGMGRDVEAGQGARPCQSQCPRRRHANHIGETATRYKRPGRQLLWVECEASRQVACPGEDHNQVSARLMFYV